MMSSDLEHQEVIYEVTNNNIKDNNETIETSCSSYIIRGLTTENEILKWSKFCEHVFSYKKPSPPTADYFYRHYKNDPQRDSSTLIRVAIYQNEIVASCRIFLRTISAHVVVQQQQEDDQSSSSSCSTSYQPVLCGGIGEVCTTENHRRKGLSRTLIKNAIEIMKSRRLSLSLLHASPTFFPIYEKLGYTCTRTEWSTVTVNCNNKDDHQQQKQQQQRQNTHSPNNSMSIRHAIFPNDIDQLYDLYQKYTQQHHRLVGCIHRTKQYWNEYLSVELKDTLFVLVMDDDNNDNNNHHDNEDRIIGWLSIRPRGHNSNNVPIFQSQEFGLDLQFTKSNACGDLSPAAVFDELLGYCVSLQDTFDDSTKNFNVMIPRFVANDIRRSSDDAITTTTTSSSTKYTIDWDSEQIHIDEGWMYIDLNDNNKEEVVVDLTCMKGETDQPIHFIYPSDSF